MFEGPVLWEPVLGPVLPLFVSAGAMLVVAEWPLIVPLNRQIFGAIPL